MPVDNTPSALLRPVASNPLVRRPAQAEGDPVGVKKVASPVADSLAITPTARPVAPKMPVLAAAKPSFMSFMQSRGIRMGDLASVSFCSGLLGLAAVGFITGTLTGSALVLFAGATGGFLLGAAGGALALIAECSGFWN